MLVPNVQHIPKPLGYEQRGRRAFALDQRIGDDRGGVNDDSVDITRANAGRSHDMRHADKESFKQVVMGGQNLVNGQHAGRVTQHDVSKCTSDIDRKRIRHIALRRIVFTHTIISSSI